MEGADITKVVRSPMDYEETKTSRFRERAEQLRTIASGTKDNSAKNALLGIADDDERLARSVTSRAAQHLSKR